MTQDLADYLQTKNTPQVERSVDSAEDIARLIKDKEKELASLRTALCALQSRKDPAASSEFSGWRPIDAIRKILSDANRPMAESELVETLVAGGLLIGKKRGHTNISVSLKTNIKTGALVSHDGLLSLGDPTAVTGESSVKS